MDKVVLIACSSQKADSRSPARDLYTSPLFRYSLRYADTLDPDDVFVLSAKHGLLPLDEDIEPYDETLNEMSAEERREWADTVLEQLRQHTDMEENRFVFLAGRKYRKNLIPEIDDYDIPLEGLPIGKQLEHLKKKVGINERCVKLHQWFNAAERHEFPFDEEKMPENGIYILFEEGEKAHDADRIVRVGTHTGDGQLRSRLKQHFIQENKDRSIFRKNIGRAFLKERNDPFLEKWNLDLTTREAQEKHSDSMDFDRQEEVEEWVTEYIQDNFSFTVFPVDSKERRLELESKIISTISLCEGCSPSKDWFGLSSPKEKIRESGLWLVNELYKEPLSEDDVDELESLLE